MAQSISRLIGGPLLAIAALVGCAESVEPSRLPSPANGAIESPAQDAVLSGRVMVAGWTAHPQWAIRRLEILLDGRPVSEADYGAPRPDVCQYFVGRPGCPNVGWHGTIDLSAARPGEHQLSVRLTGPNHECVDASQRRILVARQ